MISRKILMPLSLGLLTSVAPTAAHALDLDWSGQLRSELNWVNNYSMGNGNLPDARSLGNGYTVSGGGSENAAFQTLFARLRPKVIVNDNVYIKSEWWVGSPIYGFFGDGAPYSTDQRQYYSNQSRGSTITAQRLWLEVITDVGTLQVGRAPLNWGLGLVWNAGEGLYDRYQTTGDTVRLVSKFGAFTFVPSVVKYSMGNNVGGSAQYDGTSWQPSSGGQGVSDYALQLKYENPDEDLEGGVNFVKRIAGPAQDTNYGYLGFNGTAAGANYNTWDLYARKRAGKLTVAGEVPLTSGDIGGVSYSAFALAAEANYAVTDSWEASLKAGHAPGQPNAVNGSTDKFRAFYFNPNYKIALIMFNYALHNFVGPNSQNNPAGGTAQNLVSPYDNPITNANYLNVGGAYRSDKWRFHADYTFAQAGESAAAGSYFYNTWQRKYVDNTSGLTQSTALGWEMDYGAQFRYDDTFQFGLDLGWWFPGDFYKFSNTATSNTTGTVFATVLRAGVSF